MHEANPMLGHRGCRLAVTYPEIAEMQTRAILEAALECQDAGIKVTPEIEVPLIGSKKELDIVKAVIDATAEVAIAYKPNIAFYESRGVEGWKSLEKTIHYIRTSYPDIFTIADAKRGDIGNTSQMYAKAFLETLAFDSITVAPYMGEDSVTPFLQYEGKWVVLLSLIHI